MLAAVAIMTGCTGTVPGKPVAAPGEPAPPPVAAGDLDGLLLDEAEINAAMGATAMAVAETSKQMWDSSGEISERDCLPVYGAGEYEVYTGSGWSAMRYTGLQEPGDDPPHFAEQSVVAFPNHDVALSSLRVPSRAGLRVLIARTTSACPTSTSRPCGRWGRSKPLDSSRH